jgi:hypothetical protein
MGRRVKLTEKRAAALQPDPKGSSDTFLRDAELIGFAVRCKPSGHRSYIVEYRNATGRNRRMVLGPVGSLRLIDARDLARRYLTDARAGGDPLADRQARRKARSLEECAEAYLEEHLKPKGKPTTLREWRRVLEREILPVLGKRKAEELTRDDVRRLHQAIGQRSRRSANYTLTVLRAVLAWAEREELVDEGTAACARRVPKYPERRRERFLSPAELARLGDVLREAEKAASARLREADGRFHRRGNRSRAPERGPRPTAPSALRDATG